MGMEKTHINIVAPAKAADVSPILYLRSIGMKANGYFFIECGIALLILTIEIPKDTKPYEVVDIVYKYALKEKSLGLFWDTKTGKAFNGASW